MTRNFYSFPVEDISIAKQQMLSWASRFNICCFMDNHSYNSAYRSFECLVGAGAHLTFDEKDDFFASLTQFCNAADDWIFGHFNYDLKNKIEQLSSIHSDGIGFQDAFLFVPEVVVKLNNYELLIGVFDDGAKAVFAEIVSEPLNMPRSLQSVKIKPRISRDEYLKTVAQLCDHIQKGDCYELNFCQEFYAENAVIDPLRLYRKLADVSPNPFSGFYRVNDQYLLCASPERYLKKTGETLISQPIKGTWPRNLNDIERDSKNRSLLMESIKDRTENVMVVDLVRNDLSKICRQGSVHVTELCGIYTFPQVYQMISTISGTLKPVTDIAQIIQATFPMGSMTGAPKKRVMELIEQYEQSKRGIYSGTFGYITPQKDFDFNVVIRSIMYNALTKYLSYQVGSAITSHSIPENEYEECLSKVAAIQQVLISV